MTFPRAIAVCMADLCRRAYALAEPGPQALQVPEGWKLLGIVGDAGLVARGPHGLTALAFRGTAHLDEWLLDADYEQVPAYGGLVHRGFLSDYRQLNSKELLALVHTAHGPVAIGGHSLGAPLANYAALDLAKLKPTVVTFGSPRPGDPSFAKRYNAKVPDSWRVYNRYDAVPHLPPALMPDLHPWSAPEVFKHVGREVPVQFVAPRAGHFFGGNHAITGYQHVLEELKVAA